MAPKLLTALTAILALAATAVFALPVDDKEVVANAAGVVEGRGFYDWVKYIVEEEERNRQVLTVVYSAGGFSSIRGGAGFSSGFNILDQDGNVVYSTDAIDDYIPCTGSGGRTFSLSNGCFAKKPRSFFCETKFGGMPKHCGVSDVGGPLLVEGEGKTETEVIVIASSVSGACSFDFKLDPGEHCDPDQNGMEAKLL